MCSQPIRQAAWRLGTGQVMWLPRRRRAVRSKHPPANSSRRPIRPIPVMSKPVAGSLGGTVGVVGVSARADVNCVDVVDVEPGHRPGPIEQAVARRRAGALLLRRWEIVWHRDGQADPVHVLRARRYASPGQAPARRPPGDRHRCPRVGSVDVRPDHRGRGVGDDDLRSGTAACRSGLRQPGGS